MSGTDEAGWARAASRSTPRSPWRQCVRPGNEVLWPESRLVALVLALCVAGGSPAVALAQTAAGPSGAAASATDAGELERRLKRLEESIAALRSEVEALRAEVARTPVPGAIASRIEDLEAKIEALSAEIERLRMGEAAAQGATGGTGLGPSASKVYSIKKGVSIGGYGQMLYQNFSRAADDGSPSDATPRADLERAVLYFGYKFNDRTLFNSEVEYEHAVAGAGEPGETAVEFAYLDFRPKPAFGLRGGLLLVPMGFLNELHEPPVFLGARRPEVEQVIIPTTWRENGFGVYGSAGPMTYRTYLVTSLDARRFSEAEGVREGSQEGADALAADLAVTARVDYNPVAGLVLGASIFAGGVGQGGPGLGDARLTLWDAHAEWNWRGLHVRGLYARSGLSDAGAVSLAISAGPQAIGSRQHGGYLEVAYNLLARARGTAQELCPFVRYEALNTQDRVAPGFSADKANDRQVRTYGLSYRPITNIAIKVDYQNFQNRAGTAVDQINVSLGYLF